MAGNGPVDEAARGVARLLLDLAFDISVLGILRSEVLALSSRVGMPDDRARDVVLAVHELAANVICHGGGKGRLRMWSLAEALHCQVDDGDLIVSADHALRPDPLPELPGHGLWVARQVTSQMEALSGSHGTRVTLTFELPALGAGVPRPPETFA
jgi:anti-sigma regulatory factor (Ser/Thr protein kinase)